MFRALLALSLLTGVAHAQTESETGAVGVVVSPQSVRLYYLAVPDAINVCEVPDTRGVTEALTGTVKRDLSLAGYFELLPPETFLNDPAKEGMDPDFRAWFNIGTEGLIKVSYCITGTEVEVDMRLYAVTESKRVPLPKPYQGTVKMPIDAGQIRNHAHGFVNQVMRHFTGADGFFLSRIVFVKRQGRGKELFMVAPDGNDEVKLTNNGSTNILPSFRRNRILFTSFLNGNHDLFALEGGKAKKLTSYPGLNTGGELSPDGKFVAVTLSKDGNPDIYLVHPQTGDVIKRLTNSWGIDASATWSPDGKQLAFVSDRHGSPQLWVMNVDGSQARRITFQGDYNQTPEWNPRGDKIVFTARDERNVFDLFTVGVADGVVTRLTQDQGNNEEPSWSPDGRHLVFVSTRSGEPKLYIMTENGAVQRQLSRGKGEYDQPTWGR